MKYICVGDGDYGDLIGRGDTLDEAYERYVDNAENNGSFIAPADNCTFYFGFGRQVTVEVTTTIKDISEVVPTKGKVKK
jgi:hypothetical protein